MRLDPTWLDWTAFLVAVASIISSIELLALKREFVSGVFASRVVASRSVGRWCPEVVRSQFLFAPQTVIIAVCCRLLGSLWMIMTASSGHLNLGAVLVVAAMSLFIGYRNLIGGDGSDQMSLLITITLIPTLLFPNDAVVQLVCPWFIALQGALSYVVAGAAKALSVEWRTGSCIAPILRTAAYGHKRAAAVLESSPAFSKGICWTTIGFEMGFPISLVGSPTVTIALLSMGVVFHAGNSILMGLNCFLWAFIASYPAILHVSGITLR